jgi:hypothetical protein
LDVGVRGICAEGVLGARGQEEALVAGRPDVVVFLQFERRLREGEPIAVGGEHRLPPERHDVECDARFAYRVIAFEVIPSTHAQLSQAFLIENVRAQIAAIEDVHWVEGVSNAPVFNELPGPQIPLVGVVADVKIERLEAYEFVVKSVDDETGAQVGGEAWGQIPVQLETELE